MIRIRGGDHLHRIVVLNPKGGSGKTTLAFNVAGYLASTGRRVALVDADPQSSSMRWLQNRAGDRPPIAGIPAGRVARGASQVNIPAEIEYAVVDAPAGLASEDLADYTCGAHAILIPVLPSDLDIHAASKLVSDLLLVAQVSRRQGRLGVVANRVNERTLAYQQLLKFLDRLSISVVGHLRDTQNYTYAASEGLSIHELPKSRAGKDLRQWQGITGWLEARLASPLTPRDLRRPQPSNRSSRRRTRQRSSAWLPAAAAVLAFAVTLGWLTLGGQAPPESVTTTLAEKSIPESVTAATSGISGPSDPEPLSGPAPAAEPAPVDRVAELRERWQLNGIARVNGSSIMIVSDRNDRSTRSLGTDDELDGWTVIDTGVDYVLFSREGEHARLDLIEDSAL